MDELQPDRSEKKIRLGCGVIAGLMLGLIFGFITLRLTAGPLWLFAGVVAVAFAFFALRYGDRFWLGVLNALRGSWF